MVAILSRGGACGVKTVNPDSRKGGLVSVSDTLQLMVGFGTFVLMQIGLVVELIKNSNKK